MNLKEIPKQEYQNLYENSQFSVLQSIEWGEFKRSEGYLPRYFGVYEENSKRLVGGFLALAKSFPVVGEQGYIPRALLAIDFNDSEVFGSVLESLRGLHEFFGVVLVDLDVPMGVKNDVWLSEVGRQVERLKFGLGKTIQPQKTLIIDLEQGEEEWFARMRKSTRKEMRRSIRLAGGGSKSVQKNGVRITVAGNDSDYERVANSIESHASEHYTGRRAWYYLKMRKLFGERALAFKVEVGGKLVGGSVGLVDENQKTYRSLISGVERDVLQKHKAGYLLKHRQWTILREMGLKKLDLWGVETDPEHAWYRFSQFKLGLGGDVVEYPRQLQLFRGPLVKLAYAAYRRLRTAT